MFGIFPLLCRPCRAGVRSVLRLGPASRAWSQPGPAGEEVAGQRRISLVTEALAYVGAILVLAGGGAAVAQRWDDLGAWAHVERVRRHGPFFLVVGVVLFGVHDAAVQRLVGVLWFLSSVGVGVAAGHRGVRGLRRARRARSPVIGGATTVYAGGLWLVRRRALQNAALFGGLVVTVIGVILAVDAEPPAVVPALALWLLGVGWALLGWRRYVEPLWVSFPLGVAAGAGRPGCRGATTTAGCTRWRIATAAVVMTLSVPLHNTPLLGVGTVGMFGYVTAIGGALLR